MNKPILSKQAFWDVDMETIDYEKNAAHVVEKVIERGKAEDLDDILNFYGFNKVKELALQASWLSDISIIFAAPCLRLNQPILNVTRRNS